MKPILFASVDQANEVGERVEFDLFRDRTGNYWLVWGPDRLYEVPPDRANDIINDFVKFMARSWTAAQFESHALAGLTARGFLTNEGNERVRRAWDVVREEIE